MNDIAPEISLHHNKTDGVAAITLYSRRWFYLALFFMLNCTMSVVWVEVITVADNVSVLFSAQFFKIAQLTNIFYAGYVPGTFLATFLLKNYGLRVASVVGAVLMTISCWIRYAAAGPSMYWLQAIASGIGAIGQPCILNGCSQLSAQWFPLTERNLSTMVGETIPAALGGMIISVVVELLNSPQDPGNTAAALTALQLSELRSYFLYIAIFASAVTVVYAALFREKPPTPPGLAPRESKEVSLLETLGMFKNWNFLILLVIIDADFGMVAVLTGLLSDVLSSEHYTQTQTDLMFGCVLGGAILGGVVVAPLADKLTKNSTKPFKIILVTVNIGAFISLLGFILAIKPDNFLPMLLMLTLTSFFWTGGVPVSIEVATEIVYPLPEGAATGYLLMVANIFAFVTIMAFYGLTNVISAKDSMWLLLAIQGITVICALMFKGRYRKREAERRATRQLKNSGEHPLFRVSQVWDDTLETSLLDTPEEDTN